MSREIPKNSRRANLSPIHTTSGDKLARQLDNPSQSGRQSIGTCSPFLRKFLAFLFFVSGFALLHLPPLLYAPTGQIYADNARGWPLSSKAHPEALPLFDWEIRSAVERKCHPPPGIPSSCCLGSYSIGGRVSFHANFCNQPGIFDQVENYTMEFLQ
jgi:hypothetical protein